MFVCVCVGYHSPYTALLKGNLMSQGQEQPLPVQPEEPNRMVEETDLVDVDFGGIDEKFRAGCLRVAANDATFARLPNVEGPYLSFGVPGRWRSQPHEKEDVHSETQLLIHSLEHNTHLKEFVWNVQSLQLLEKEAWSKLQYFFLHNPNLEILRIRIPPNTKKAPLHHIFKTGKPPWFCCPNLKELHLWIPPRLSLPQQYRRMRRRRAPASSSPSRFSYFITAASTPCAPSYYDNEHPQLQDHGLQSLSKWMTQSKSLQVLYIRNSMLGPGDLVTLGHGISQNTSLQRLELANVQSSARAGAMGGRLSYLMRGIAQSQSLQALSLVGCYLDGEDWDALLSQHQRRAQRNLPSSSLRTLQLQSLPVPMDQPFRRFMALLRQPTSRTSASITTLEISRTNLHSCISMIADMLQCNTALRELSLIRCQLDIRDGALLALGLQSNHTLEHLLLSDNHIVIGSEFMTLLQVHSNLKTIDLSNNTITAHPNGSIETDGLYQLFSGLVQNSTTKLQSLLLSNEANLFQERLLELFGDPPRVVPTPVASVMASVLAYPQCPLTKLVLNFHRLEPVNATLLVTSLRSNTNLKVLELKSVSLDDTTLEALANQVLATNSALQYLDVSHNRALSQTGFHPLAKALRTNTGLQTLKFDGFREDGKLIMQQCAQILEKVLVDNTTLQYISYADCSLSPMGRWYLQLNQYGRRWLSQSEGQCVNGAESSVNSLALWAHVLAKSSHDPALLIFFVSQRVDLIPSSSSVSTISASTSASPASNIPTMTTTMISPLAYSRTGNIRDSSAPPPRKLVSDRRSVGKRNYKATSKAKHRSSLMNVDEDEKNSKSSPASNQKKRRKV